MSSDGKRWAASASGGDAETDQRHHVASSSVACGSGGKLQDCRSVCCFAKHGSQWIARVAPSSPGVSEQFSSDVEVKF